MSSAADHAHLFSTSLTAGEAAVPTVVDGQGVWLTLADGRRVIDASNTAAPLGHRHPEIVEAVRRAADSPALNEGWGWRGRNEAANDIVRTALGDADGAWAVRFFISASEANDVALTLAQALTGRADLATRQRAYHGGLGLARDLTTQPHWHGGLAGLDGTSAVPPRSVAVHVLPAPTGARVTGQADPTADGEWEQRAFEQLSRSAAVLVDYSQGGVYHTARYQDRVAALAREAGALWIADETVTGFGRVGGWFQFQHADSRPDIVSVGKSLAAGAAPAGALLLSRDVVEQIHGRRWQTYSTFRGHPSAVAAISAHIRVSTRDGICGRALAYDEVMLERMHEVARSHPSVARIDGRGLHWTVEVHGPDWRDWRGEEAEPIASRVAARAMDAGVLFSTSAEQTSLFVAPPLIVEGAEVDRIFDALHHGLELADEECM